MGSDPTERTSSTGERYVTANLRQSNGRKNVLIRMAAFNASAADRLEVAAKGEPIAAFGELQLNRWKDRQGNEHRDWRMLVSEVKSVTQGKLKEAMTARKR